MPHRARMVLRRTLHASCGRSSCVSDARGGEVAYDSADRPQAMIAAMEAKGVPPHAIETRTSADAARATPASAAVSSPAPGGAIQQTPRRPRHGPRSGPQ